MSNSSYSVSYIRERTKTAEDEVVAAVITQSPARSLTNLVNLWEMADNQHRRFLFQALATHYSLMQRGEQDAACPPQRETLYSIDGRGNEALPGLDIQVNVDEVLSQIGAKLLLESLSQEELISLQKRETPSDLAALLSGLASEEARRRRDA